TSARIEARIAYMHGPLVGLAETRPQAAKASPAALADGLERDVEHRDHEKADCAGGDHPGEDRGADVVATDLGGALCDDQRVDAEDEGEGGHHHGAETHPCAEHRGFPDVHSLLAPVLGKLDDQD